MGVRDLRGGATRIGGRTPARQKGRLESGLARAGFRHRGATRARLVREPRSRECLDLGSLEDARQLALEDHGTLAIEFEGLHLELLLPAWPPQAQELASRVATDPHELQALLPQEQQGQQVTELLQALLGTSVEPQEELLDGLEVHREACAAIGLVARAPEEPASVASGLRSLHLEAGAAAVLAPESIALEEEQREEGLTPLEGPLAGRAARLAAMDAPIARHEAASIGVRIQRG